MLFDENWSSASIAAWIMIDALLDRKTKALYLSLFMQPRGKQSSEALLGDNDFLVLSCRVINMSYLPSR